MDIMGKTRWIALLIVAGLVGWSGCSTTPEPTAEEVNEQPETEEDVDDPIEQELALGSEGPAGGLIFYVDRDDEFDWSYLEAAPEGWFGEDEDPATVWGEVGVETGGAGVEIGTGMANTQAIVGQLDESAAALAAEAQINGFDDWFLPSEAEMYALYENLVRNGMGGLSPESYWSSTERNPDRAMVIGIGTGGKISGMKDQEYKIRPIRAF